VSNVCSISSQAGQSGEPLDFLVPAAVEERQTRELQVLVSERTWGFESPPPHFPQEDEMHSRETVAEALRLRDEMGLGARRVSRRLGLPLGTVRDWHAGKLPWHSRSAMGHRRPNVCEQCDRPTHRFDELGPAYVHLLGLYLGDGSISTHRRGVYRLRVFLDRKYPLIVDECEAAMLQVMPGQKAHRLLTPSNCYSVSAYSRSWPCLFPQHGPGLKHNRRIFLAKWQQRLAERWPEQLIKGLIQSDGCRFMNTGKGGWRHPRYAFTNVSTDITSIFCSACDCLGLRWTASFPNKESAAVSIYVSRKEDVARLDEFVGPKR
jgi:hypothetical protein